MQHFLPVLLSTKRVSDERLEPNNRISIHVCILRQASCHHRFAVEQTKFIFTYEHKTDFFNFYSRHEDEIDDSYATFGDQTNLARADAAFFSGTDIDQESKLTTMACVSVIDVR